MKKLSIAFFFSLFTTCAWAAGGTCPSGANYLSLTSPQTGGGLGSVTLSSLGVTQCYFVAASGSDSNNGTAEGTPWRHAPQMPNFTGSYTAANGDGIIIRGGDTYHASASTSSSTDTPMGGVWAWTHSGSGANPIYIGIDPTWFAGGSFARPIFTWDNALSTSTVSSCNVANDDNTSLISFSGDSNVIEDGFEFTGQCSTGSAHSQYLFMGTSVITERNYAHGWTLTTGASDDIAGFVGPQTNATGNRHLFDVVDGQDSTYGTTCTTTSCVQNGGANLSNGATGWAFVEGYDLEYSVVRHTSQGIEANNISILNGNLMEYIFSPSFGGRHGNVIEALGGPNSSTCYIYNNIFRNLNQGVYLWPQCDTQYYFNNVFENISASGGANNANCIMLSPQGNSNVGVVTTVLIANNTTDATCVAQAYPGNAGTPHWASGSTITVQNMHILDHTGIFGGSYSAGFWFNCNSPSVCSQTDSGGEVFQTSTVANGQGYTLSNNYAPTLNTNATVGAGNNLTSSCSTYSTDSELCSGTSGAVSEISKWGGQFASYPTITVVSRPSSGAWDSGAYEFGTPTVANPVFSPAPGTYTANQTITITDSTGGATICYTRDGTTPTTNGAGTCTHGTTYSGTFSVTSKETDKAIATLSGDTDSSVVTAAYTLQGGPPTCSPGAGNYASTQTVTLTSPQSQSMCYRTDGTNPSSNGSGSCSAGSTLYSGTITVSASETILSIGMASGWTDSTVSSCVYTIGPLPTPSATLSGGAIISGGTIIK